MSARPDPKRKGDAKLRRTNWHRRLTLLCVLAVSLSGVLFSGRAEAFPPYRSTDADTADPGTVELRLGLIRVERDGGHDTVSTPLLRLNLGLPGHAELVSEFEYVPREGRLGDAAIGAKWVPFRGTPAVGVEALALLPVREDDRGLGFEGQIVTTLPRRDVVLHVNGGGFYDARPTVPEAGWRASALVEVPLEGFRPGLEAFAKQEFGKGVDGRTGLGMIVNLGRFDLRAGLHAGVTREAPDFVVSFWIATKFAP
jgi:hypothetical protein